MTRYVKKSYKHNKSHNTSNNNHYPSTNHKSTLHLDKHTCKSCNTNNQVNKIIGQAHTSENTKSEPEYIKDPHDSDNPDSNLDSSSNSEWLSKADKIIEVKLSNMKYAANFPVTINKNNTISLFDIEAIISCMSKVCFNKLQPKLTLVQTNTYKENGADGISLGQIGNDHMYSWIPYKISTIIHHSKTLTSNCYSRIRLFPYILDWNSLVFF